jgi:hypothetical protein
VLRVGAVVHFTDVWKAVEPPLEKVRHREAVGNVVDLRDEEERDAVLWAAKRVSAEPFSCCARLLLCSPRSGSRWSRRTGRTQTRRPCSRVPQRP